MTIQTIIGSPLKALKTRLKALLTAHRAIIREILHRTRIHAGFIPKQILRFQTWLDAAIIRHLPLYAQTIQQKEGNYDDGRKQHQGKQHLLLTGVLHELPAAQLRAIVVIRAARRGDALHTRAERKFPVSRQFLIVVLRTIFPVCFATRFLI